MRTRGSIPETSLLYGIRPYFDTLQRATPGYLFAVDLNEGIVLLSDSFVRDFDLPDVVLEDMDSYWLPLIEPDDRELYLLSLQDVMEDRENMEHEHDFDYRVRYRSGEYGWVNCHGVVGYDEEGTPVIWTGIIMQMDRVVRVDMVTKLLNRYALYKAMSKELESVAVDPETFEVTEGAVMVVGLDNFQIINETYGYQFGDLALRQIAQNISNLLPSDLHLYKMDGNQFAILWPQAMPEEVEILFSSIQLSLRDIHGVEEKVYCTASAGAAFYPRDGMDVDTLLKHAEAAMSMAIQQGRDRICFFSQEAYDKWRYDISMETLMKNCIARGCDDFFLYYQPQVDARDGRLLGAEALLRWRDNDGEILAPMQFIPLLEKSRMIIPVGHWIVEQAVITCKECQKYMPDFQMSINISLYQLEEHTFYPFVKECLERYDIDPHTITFELTESQSVSDWEFVNRQFAQFHELGIRIAMDDFGTGYSSLGFLKHFACDIIKIDRVFVQDILKSDFDRNLVKYTIMLCHSIGMEVCIEGVEEEAPYLFLRDECKADVIQGFYFGYPEPKDVFMERLIH